jgi:hypothetical protein
MRLERSQAPRFRVLMGSAGMSRAGRRQSAVAVPVGGTGTRTMSGGAEKGGDPVENSFTVICEVAAP